MRSNAQSHNRAARSINDRLQRRSRARRLIRIELLNAIERHPTIALVLDIRGLDKASAR
jgi:hypothetical protein